MFFLFFLKILVSFFRKAFFQDDNNLYFVTDFVNGGELFSHIRKREKLALDASKFIAVEVACALQSVHDYGVVYRGVKPENILLGSCYLSMCPVFSNVSRCTL